MRNKPRGLTARERDVVRLISEGFTNQQIGEVLMLSVRTVEAHRARLMIKLQIHDIAGLAKYAIREGLTKVEQHHVI